MRLALLTLVPILVISACSSSATPPAPGPTPAATPVADPTPAAAPAPTPAPAEPSPAAAPAPEPVPAARPAPTPTPAPPPVPPGATPRLGDACGANDACPAPMTCVSYFGIAGARGPQFKTCEIKCKPKSKDCPSGTTCRTIADGPGSVCR